MSDSDDILNGDGETPGVDTGKKASGLGALLPHLLRFAAIGIGAAIFIITVTVITVSVLGTSGSGETVIPANSPFAGARQEHQFFSSIGQIRTYTSDPVPASVVVDMVIGYDLNDNVTQTELGVRTYELTDFVRAFFRAKKADELQYANEEQVKREILEALNTKILNTGRARIIVFRQFDVMSNQ